MDQDEFNRLFKFDFLKRTTLAAGNNSRDNTNTILELIVGPKGIEDLIRDEYYDEAVTNIGKVIEQVLTQLGNLDSDIRKAFPINNSHDFIKWADKKIKDKIDFLARLGIYDGLILKKIDDLRANRNDNAHFNKRNIEKSKEAKRHNAIESVKKLHDVLLYFHKMYEKSNSWDTFFDANLDNVYIPTKTNQKLHRNNNYSGNNTSSYSSTPYSTRRNVPYHEPSSSSNYGSSSYDRTHHNMAFNNSSSSNNYEDNFARNVEQQGQKPVSYWTRGIKIWGTIILVALVLIPAFNSCLDKYNASFENNTAKTNTDDDSDSDQSSSDQEKADPDLKWKKQFAGQVFRLSVIANAPDNFKLGNEDVDFNDVEHFVPNLMNRPRRGDESGNTYVIFDSNVKSNKVVVTDQMSTATDAYRHPNAFNKLYAEQSRTGKNYYSVKNDGFTLDISKIKIYQYNEIGAYPTLFLSSSGMQKVDNSFKNVFKNEDIHEFLQMDQVNYYDQEDEKEITLSGNDFEREIKNQPLTVKYKFEVVFELLDMDDSDY